MTEPAPYTTRDPEAVHPCPACGEPRQVLAKRHKVLGAWVPEWEVQPCRNPRCRLYVPDDGEPRGGEPRGGEEPSGGAVPRGEDGAEATSTHVTGKNGETGRSQAAG
ncbi:hypothetical protein [Streptomyces roseicoloratus]|uniref:Uncharacterized protein n=1 Tax=Streptomyces roseicoloratus TaxID=2508722 RepID=A0ABY9RUG3_9ACTN|nr:hypothetical protein [Streptomyces roseicoloratus]WMX45121.1 hypothetical protein RGF97_09980 [Streptomyces roseicoloratus]